MTPLLLLAALLGMADGEATLVVARLDVFPRELALEGPADAHGLIVRAVDENGVQHDLTGAATARATDPAIARVEGGVVRGVADGACEIEMTAGGATARVSVRVSAMAAPVRPPSFRLDVMPVFARSACNNGSCHGSSRGQDGFRLSLFGFDEAADYRSVTRELPGRRLDFASPVESLLLRKSIGEVPHTGGKRFGKDDPRYATLLAWITAGAKPDPEGTAAPTEIEIYPQNLVLGVGSTMRMGVRAKYSDGTDRDVTTLATFISSNDYSAKVSEWGEVSAAAAGEAQILARFGAFTVGAGAIVLPPGAGPAPQISAGANFIDDAINAKLKDLRITPSELCTDAEFLRRASLDLNGLLPTAQERERFLADSSADKRAKLVDELIARKEFTEIWVMKWSERLGIRSTPEVSPKATLLYAEWLQSRIASGAPIDRIVRELLASSGGTFDTPSTNFYQLETDTLKLSENVAQAFLGTRIQCAQCHNHPFDRWTMDDYYGFAAFFTRVGRKPGEDPRETVVFNSPDGDIKHPIGGSSVAPRFLGSDRAPAADKDRRLALAEWLTSADNTMFARNISNFVWAHFFHRGIVEPVDDVRVSNPPVNGALLDALAARLVADAYDFRPLVRAICLSNAYQRSTRSNESNERDASNFSHAQPRRIRAEFMLDSISRVTRTQDKFRGLPLGSRAVQIADGSTSNYFLSTFGRATRATVCTCEVVMEPSLSQALHLINGETVSEKIRQGGRVRAELAAGRTPAQVLDGLYAECLGREPSETERAVLLAPLAEGVEPGALLEDAFWALLNSREFMFNH
ncbi:MAG: DUF1549 domain-containing protein [Phycisphaerales bacterium]